MDDQENLTGVIVSLVEDKGYGFIEVEGYEKHIFFHAKDCQGVRFEQLRKGDKVSIGQVTEKDRGKQARNVSLL